MQAILLDRDGVINCERADYVKSWQEFQLLPGVLPALARLATLPIPIAVISNQSAIGRGIIEAAVVTDLHQRLHNVVTAAGGRIDGFFVCPHHPADKCGCRKPQPGLLQQAAQQFAFSLAEAVFIGDAITDYEAACAAGCHAILVRSGRQGADLDRRFVDAVLPPPIVADLVAAVDLLFNHNHTKDQTLAQQMITTG
jgi:D-glycero-D-manno-heptose 1,7-bisphosphate phosphatase